MATRRRTRTSSFLALAAIVPAAAAGQPPIRHVFLVLLENENADDRHSS